MLSLVRFRLSLFSALSSMQKEAEQTGEGLSTLWSVGKYYMGRILRNMWISCLWEMYENRPKTTDTEKIE